MQSAVSPVPLLSESRIQRITLITQIISSTRLGPYLN